MLSCIGAAIVLAGCTIHPPGEPAERQAAADAGRPYQQRFDQRQIPPLPPNPTRDDLVRHAMLANADLEQRYWEWQSALEQIPQDGTQATNLALFGSAGMTRGRMSMDSTTLSLGNDPMADIVLPAKLSAAARRALENARAAGMRFRKAQFELRAKVLSAYDDYALTAELARLEQANASLLQTTLTVVEAKNRVGAGSQQDLLKAHNELDISRNDLASLQAQLPGQQAGLNALLGQPATALIPLPREMPATRPISPDDAHVLALTADRNPELAAIDREALARRESIALAKLQYLPDFSLTVGTDLAGIAQSLAGMLTIPLLRQEAIRAAVAQVEANLRANEAMHRQFANDLAARVVSDLATIRDANRQLALFRQSLLPRAEMAVSLSRSSYEAGQSSLLDLLDTQRSLIALRRLVANLATTRDKRLVELESITASDLSTRPHVPATEPVR
ncbi:MAG TPA: TolC family protein [Tepidisphaeraceae bacterium]